MVLENTYRQEDEIDRGFELWGTRTVNSCSYEVGVQLRLIYPGLQLEIGGHPTYMGGYVEEREAKLNPKGIEGDEYILLVKWIFGGEKKGFYRPLPDPHMVWCVQKPGGKRCDGENDYIKSSSNWHVDLSSEAEVDWQGNRKTGMD